MHRSNIMGCLGGVCLGLFWLAPFFTPQRVYALPRPYGLLIWFGVLLGAVVLPTVAAMRSSKWWLAVTAASAMTIFDFFAHVIE